MEDYPRTLMEFEKRFDSETKCRDYLAKLRWPEGFQCPRCQSRKPWMTKQGLYYCSACEYKSSVTSGTVFQDTSKPLKLWFMAMWHVTNQKHGISALGLQRTLGLGSYHTAWGWLHKLRSAMVRPNRDRLSGTVEVDETFIGGYRSGKRGRGAEGKTLVVAATEKEGDKPGRIRLKRVPDASEDSLKAAVTQGVELKSIIHTDGWRGYNWLDRSGYARRIIRKQADVGDNLLPLVNLVASLLKRWLLGTHQGAVKTSHLDYYLDEFTFRFNRRTSKSRGMLFYRLLQQSVEIAPVPIKNIAGARTSIPEPQGIV